jgi:hypothetical protein
VIQREQGWLQQLGFFVERPVGQCPRDAAQTGARESLTWIGVSEGRSQLVVSPQSLPRVVAGEVGQGAGALAAGQQPAESIVLQPVRQGFQSFLALMAPARQALRVNGVPVGPVAILSVKDQLRLGEYLLHVSLLCQPMVGPPRGAEVGAECAVCRTPLLAVQTVYRCTNCSAALHAGHPQRPENDRLECAAVCSDCPRCRARLARKREFAYVPEI